MEIIATGFRAPNGMTVGPNDVITVSEQSGPLDAIEQIEPHQARGILRHDPRSAP